MSILINALIIGSLSIIAFQDFKERKVWFFLFPLFGILGGLLFYRSSHLSFFWISIALNLIIVMVIIFMNYLISKFLFKKDFFKEAIGLGDLLFFVCFTCCFPTMTFVYLFVFSILFTLILFWKLNKMRKSEYSTVPLAGSMGLFLIAIYVSHWAGIYQSIYLL